MHNFYFSRCKSYIEVDEADDAPPAKAFRPIQFDDRRTSGESRRKPKVISRWKGYIEVDEADDASPAKSFRTIQFDDIRTRGKSRRKPKVISRWKVTLRLMKPMMRHQQKHSDQYNLMTEQEARAGESQK